MSERTIESIQNDYRNQIYKFGFASAVSTSNTIIWDGNNGFSGFFDTAQSVTVASTDPDDAVGGGGAIALEINGLDANLLQIKEYITLTGTTSVTLTNQYRFIFRMRCLTEDGSASTEDTDPFTGPNHGTITAVGGGQNMAIVGATNGQTLMAIYQVPSNKYGELLSVDFFAPNNSTFFASNSLFCKVLYQVQGTGAWNVGGFIHGADNKLNEDFTEEFPQLLLPGTKIMLCGQTTAGSIGVAGTFKIKLKDVEV